MKKKNSADMCYLLVPKLLGFSVVVLTMVPFHEKCNDLVNTNAYSRTAMYTKWGLRFFFYIKTMSKQHVNRKV